MSRFALVDSAPLAPGGCMICGGLGAKNAKLLDWMQEFSAQQLRLYTCKGCFREAAQTFGYAKGERMDELDKAAEQIVEIEQEAEKAKQAARKMAEALTQLQERHGVLERELQMFRDREAAQIQRVREVVTTANQLLVEATGNGG